MAKNKTTQADLTYAPQQYAPQSQGVYMPPVPYSPTTQPIRPTVSPANPSLSVLSNDSVIIAPKKPPRSLRPITFKALFRGIILFVLLTFIIFMIGTYFFVDAWNPFKIIGDFFTEFDFGKFFREFFTGQT